MTTDQTINSWYPVSATEWLQKPQIAEKDLVRGWIKTNGINLVSGQSKRARKSLFVNAAGMCVATGCAAFGLEPTTQGRVLLVQEESPPDEYKEQLLALAKGMRIPVEALKDLYLAHQVGLRLDDPDWVSRLQEIHKDFVFIALDPWTGIHGSDANEETAMQRVLDPIRAMRREGQTFVIVAHLDKQFGENRRADMDKQLRGSGVLVNNYDRHIALRRYNEVSPYVTTQVRSKHGATKYYQLEWAFANTGPRGATLDQARLSIKEVENNAEQDKQDKQDRQRSARDPGDPREDDTRFNNDVDD